jgi:predicted nuclease with TOPRIM domain
VSTEGSKIKVPTLADLIERRDDLKIQLDLQCKLGTQHHDPVRHELNQCVGAITEILHAPFEREAVRLREKRQEIAGQLEAAQHRRAGLRNAYEHAQGARMATLARGDDATTHLLTSKAGFTELQATEDAIADLEHRLRGVDARMVALVELEAVNIASGVSAA